MEQLVPVVDMPGNRGSQLCKVYADLEPYLPCRGSFSGLEKPVPKRTKLLLPLLHPMALLQLAKEDEAWASWKHYKGSLKEKLSTLAGRVRLLRTHWHASLKHHGDTRPLIPLAIDLLASIKQALVDCQELAATRDYRKLRDQIVPKITALVLWELVSKKEDGAGDDQVGLLGQALDSMPLREDYREVFTEVLEALAASKELPAGWEHRLVRALDTVLVDDEEHLNLQEIKTQEIARRDLEKCPPLNENSIGRGSPRSIEFDKSVDLGNEFGLARWQGKRNEQQDDAWYGQFQLQSVNGDQSLEYVVVADGHRGTAATEYFKKHLNNALVQALEGKDCDHRVTVYNAVTEALRKLNARWKCDESSDVSGFTGAFVMRVGAFVHFFSWGDVRIVCSDNNSIDHLLPADIIEADFTTDERTHQARLLRRVQQRSGVLLTCPGEHLHRIVQSGGGLNMCNAFGDKDFNAMSFRPWYRSMSVVDAKGKTFCMYTDGIGAFVSPTQVARYLQCNPSKTPSQIAKNLIRFGYRALRDHNRNVQGMQKHIADNALAVVIRY